jgi:hypothetical protein
VLLGLHEAAWRAAGGDPGTWLQHRHETVDLFDQTFTTILTNQVQAVAQDPEADASEDPGSE